jgi:hypothetical protein
VKLVKDVQTRVPESRTAPVEPVISYAPLHAISELVDVVNEPEPVRARVLPEELVAVLAPNKL